MSEHINTDPLAGQVFNEQQTNQVVKELSEWVTASAKNATFRVVGTVEEENWSKQGPGGKAQRKGKSKFRKRNISSRTKGRMRAVDTIYEAIVKGLDHEPQQIRKLIADRQQISTAQSTLPDFSIQLLTGWSDHLFEIDMIIEQFSRGWSLDRMPPVDLAIMRLGVWEMKFSNDVTDDRIVVDEMVKIAALISTDDSPAFVNAMLDRISKTDLKSATASAATGVGLLMEDDLDLDQVLQSEEPTVDSDSSLSLSSSAQTPAVASAKDTSVVALPAENTMPTSPEETSAAIAETIDFDAEALDSDVANLVSKLLEQ